MHVQLHCGNACHRLEAKNTRPELANYLLDLIK